MSLRKLEPAAHGKDVELPLHPTLSPVLLVICAVAGVGFSWLGTTERATAKNIVWLAWGLGLFFLVLSGLAGLRLAAQRRRPYVARIGTRTFTWCPADGAPGKRWEGELRRFDRTLVQTSRNARNLVVETEGRIVLLFGGAWQLSPAEEPRFIEVLERRMHLCREGADSRDEVGCAEAYLAERKAGRDELGIAVERVKKSRVYWAVGDRADLEAALAKGFVAYVPERAHRTLAETVGEPANLRPMRGVDRG